jgi:hypothetical protein
MTRTAALVSAVLALLVVAGLAFAFANFASEISAPPSDRNATPPPPPAEDEGGGIRVAPRTAPLPSSTPAAESPKPSQIEDAGPVAAPSTPRVPLFDAEQLALAEQATYLNEPHLTLAELRELSREAELSIHRHTMLYELASGAVEDGRTEGTKSVAENASILLHVVNDLPALVSRRQVLARITTATEGYPSQGVDYLVSMGTADLHATVTTPAGEFGRVISFVIPHSVVPSGLWEDIYRRKPGRLRRMRPSEVEGAGIFQGRFFGR